jgi:hypothetical protein
VEQIKEVEKRKEIAGGDEGQRSAIGWFTAIPGLVKRRLASASATSITAP